VVAFAVLGACLRPVLSPSPLTNAVATLNRLCPGERTVFVWQAGDPVAGQLRLLSGGTLTVKTLAPEAGVSILATARAVITVSPFQQRLADAGYQIVEVTAVNAALTNSWLGRLMVEKAADVRNSPRQSFWVGVKSQ
jgi:hypothetical protein